MKPNDLAYNLLIIIGFTLEKNHYLWDYRQVKQTLEKAAGLKYHLSTIRKEFSLLKRDCFIELKTRYRKPVPILTQKGKLAIKTRLPFKSFGAWDQKWRLVIFDVPEIERKYRWALRAKLYELNFGQIQKSAYLSPYPLLGTISRFAADLGIRQHLRMMEVAKIDGEKKLIEQAWDLEKVNANYQNFINHAMTKPKDKFWPLRAKKLEREFASLYETDPQLPKEFLPKNWAGKIAYKVFKEISNSY